MNKEELIQTEVSVRIQHSTPVVLQYEPVAPMYQENLRVSMEILRIWYVSIHILN